MTDQLTTGQQVRLTDARDIPPRLRGRAGTVIDRDGQLLTVSVTIRPAPGERGSVYDLHITNVRPDQLEAI